MPDLHLSMATGTYDHLRDLTSGRIKPAGIQLISMELPVEEIFFRTFSFQEWDVAEFSLAKYVSLIGTGSELFWALPVFPSRMFRHSAFYVATAAGIKTPADLAGKRIGVPEWSQTAGVYARALLQHQHGVRLRDIDWVQGGVNEAGRHEKVELRLPDGVNVQRVTDKALSDMLIDGELDAIITAREPKPFVEGDLRIARLWPEFQRVEEAFFRETAIYPIMHVIVLRKTMLEEHPWVATNLLHAFEQSKANSLSRLATIVNSPAPMPWTNAALNHAKSILGEDPFPYGIEPNRKVLEAFTGYCYEQGVTSRPVTVEELFPPQVTRATRV